MNGERVCGRCGGVLQEAETFCPYCGCRVEQAADLPESGCFCMACGARNRAEDVFCVECGARLSGAEEEAQAAEAQEAELPPVTEPETPEEPAAAEETVLCAGCGARNGVGDIFCAVCGKRLHALGAADQAKAFPEQPVYGEADEETDPYASQKEAREAEPTRPHERASDRPTNAEKRSRQSLAVGILWGVFGLLVLLICWLLLVDGIKQALTKDEQTELGTAQPEAETEMETEQPEADAPSPTSAQTSSASSEPVSIDEIVLTTNGTTETVTWNKNLWQIWTDDGGEIRWYGENTVSYDVVLKTLSDGRVIIQSTRQSENGIKLDPGALEWDDYALEIIPYDANGTAGKMTTMYINADDRPTELFDFLGGTREKLTAAKGGEWKKSDQEDGDEADQFVRKDLELLAATPLDLNCVTHIEVNGRIKWTWEKGGNCTVCGLNYHMAMDDALELLQEAGWRLTRSETTINQEKTRKHYQDADGNMLSVVFEEEKVVKASLTLSESILAEKYAASGVQQAASQATGTLRTTGDVNIRTGPGREYAIVGMIRADSTASYQGESRTDERGVVWYRIAWDGKEGWVSSKYAELMN